MGARDGWGRARVGWMREEGWGGGRMGFWMVGKTKGIDGMGTIENR